MRKFAPLLNSHPLVGTECPACKQPFVTGDEVTLIALGPGNDPEAQERAREGRAYTSAAVPVHWECSGYEDREPYLETI
jgi:hypothetical protein